MMDAGSLDVTTVNCTLDASSPVDVTSVHDTLNASSPLDVGSVHGTLDASFLEVSSVNYTLDVSYFGCGLFLTVVALVCHFKWTVYASIHREKLMTLSSGWPRTTTSCQSTSPSSSHVCITLRNACLLVRFYALSIYQWEHSKAYGH